MRARPHIMGLLCDRIAMQVSHAIAVGFDLSGKCNMDGFLAILFDRNWVILDCWFLCRWKEEREDGKVEK